MSVDACSFRFNFSRLTDIFFCLGTLLKVDHVLPDPAPIRLYLPPVLHEMESPPEQRRLSLHIYLDTRTDANDNALQGRAGRVWGHHLDDRVRQGGPCVQDCTS